MTQTKENYKQLKTRKNIIFSLGQCLHFIGSLFGSVRKDILRWFDLQWELKSIRANPEWFLFSFEYVHGNTLM